VIVAGTTDAGPDGRSVHPGDAGAQARAAFGIVERALAAAGASLDDVVRTRMYLVDRADVAAVTAVHGELFGTVRPAATLVLVAGLIDETLRVEVEVEAVLPGAASR
jgi:enamine deaminase RidA (YjgF/YER057c/UK114 family)